MTRSPAPRQQSNPSLFTAVLEDTADHTELALAFLGVRLGHRLTSPHLDGMASLRVGFLLAARPDGRYIAVEPRPRA